MYAGENRGQIHRRTNKSTGVVVALSIFVVLAILVVNTMADVPGKQPPIGIVPNPGTQEKELPNLTAPGTHNTFEFPQFCANCHGGSVDQQVSHYGNWSGSNMANSGRDPIFRANNLIVNADATALGGVNGTGNICWRCHSPNGWYSGRLDESLGGRIDGTTLQQSLLASTDMQGIMCEFCHRTVGNVTMQRKDLDSLDPVWNMLAGILDWPHAGIAYPEGPRKGFPYGDTTFQINDGKVYQADLPGNWKDSFSDTPLAGTSYTGQTYGIYPPSYTGPKNPVPPGMPALNPLGQEIHYNTDGSVGTHFERPAGVPIDPVTGLRDLNLQSTSPRHSTHDNGFLTTSEMCGTCHDLTVPTFNHGMPEQRTYTEWKLSDFGNPNSPRFTICQDCHMGEYSHEYEDGLAGTFKADPRKAGFFPYAKARSLSAVHKFHGANRDLPKMLKILYPEVDLEITGESTGSDTRTKTGVMSSRDLTWDRHIRNSELMLLDCASILVTQQPTLVDAATNKWSVMVKVTNLSGHAIPSGYPDGRRLFVRLDVRDSTRATVYESGYWDPASAHLYNDSTLQALSRARSPLIDSASKSVMIYEKRTGTLNPDGTTYSMGVNLLNETILFDNRLRPAGFRKAASLQAGVRLVNYTGPKTAAVPFDESGRYANGQNWDDVTYSFTLPAGVTPVSARAELYMQTHSREFMEYLKDRNSGLAEPGPRPEGQPDIRDPNYPVSPNYIGEKIGLTTMTDLNGNLLQDNWGSLAYAAWLLTGKGEPFLVASDDSDVTAAPVAPAGVLARAIDPFTIKVSWKPVSNADGYVVWTRYGTSDLTASWDRLAVVRGATTFLNEGLKVGKTYGYKVTAFNGKGVSLDSASVTAKTRSVAALPDEPFNLELTRVIGRRATLNWLDRATNETGFVIERQDVPNLPAAPMPPFVEVARIPAVDTPGTGIVSYTDNRLKAGRTYNYRVAAYNAVGRSLYNDNGPVEVSSIATPTRLAIVGVRVRSLDLSWTDNSDNETGFHVERSLDGTNWKRAHAAVGPGVTSFTDTGLASLTPYWYRIRAFNEEATSARSNIVTATTK